MGEDEILNDTSRYNSVLPLTEEQIHNIPSLSSVLNVDSHQGHIRTLDTSTLTVGAITPTSIRYPVSDAAFINTSISYRATSSANNVFTMNFDEGKQIRIRGDGFMELVSGSETRVVDIWGINERMSKLEEKLSLIMEEVPKKLVSKVLRDKVNL